MDKSILWMDLTVEDAEEVRDFYSEVIGWKTQPLDMGSYDDFVMVNDDQEPIAGVCHARGENADLPPVWIAYVQVESVDKSIKTCIEKGGQVIKPATPYSSNKKYAIIQDPAGATCAIWSEEDSP
ncbi:MAG: VOC family protein [Bacteroidetes bacterium]|nr:VOC family protein [Bacteroidota bacterium]MCY4224875.1 VOC family protein [Bacteroidota bacterium]